MNFFADLSDQIKTIQYFDSNFFNSLLNNV